MLDVGKLGILQADVIREAGRPSHEVNPISLISKERGRYRAKLLTWR